MVQYHRPQKSKIHIELQLSVHHYGLEEKKEGGRERDSKVCFLRRELCDKVKKGRESGKKRREEKWTDVWTAIKSKHSRIKKNLSGKSKLK